MFEESEALWNTERERERETERDREREKRDIGGKERDTERD